MEHLLKSQLNGGVETPTMVNQIRSKELSGTQGRRIAKRIAGSTSALASGGYPWTVIRVEDRDAYLSALDPASIDSDMGPREIQRAARALVDGAGHSQSRKKVGMLGHVKTLACH